MGAQNYQAAREQMLDDIVPHEDYNAKTSCLFRTCCCFYYMFCCCICCEKSKSVTKQTFVKRFEKWLNIESRIGRRDKTLKVAKTMMRMYAHQPGAIADLDKQVPNPRRLFVWMQPFPTRLRPAYCSTQSLLGISKFIWHIDRPLQRH